MSEIISDDQIDQIASLAKLELSFKEKCQAKEDMEKMLKYINTLKELDTAKTEPLVHAFSGRNVFREDVITNGDASKELLSGAPSEKEGYYLVPKTME